MDFEFYRNFITVAETGNLTTASKKLALAQPALSAQIKTLEHYYGAKLIQTARGKRQLTLTEAGEAFLGKARQICCIEYFFLFQKGVEIGHFYGYEYAGVDENGNMLILNDKDEQIPISQADAKYKRYIGNGAPKHFLSWSNNLTWRNFDLSVFFRGTFGFDVFNMRKYGMGLQGCGTDNVLRSAYLEDNIYTREYFLKRGGARWG